MLFINYQLFFTKYYSCYNSCILMVYKGRFFTVDRNVTKLQTLWNKEFGLIWHRPAHLSPCEAKPLTHLKRGCEDSISRRVRDPTQSGRIPPRRPKSLVLPRVSEFFTIDRNVTKLQTLWNKNCRFDLASTSPSVSCARQNRYHLSEGCEDSNIMRRAPR
jgi:hypothetical protein